MPDPTPAAPDGASRQWLCASGDLAERGKAVVFNVLQYRRVTPAFALRFEGRVVAYLNRCLHVPVEMDWQPGEFLDSRREFIICSMHGASYAPDTGHCAGGPCGRGRLTPVTVQEWAGQVYWYPSTQVRPLFE